MTFLPEDPDRPTPPEARRLRCPLGEARFYPAAGPRG